MIFNSLIQQWIELEFYNFKDKINLDATFELRSIDEVVIFHHGALISQNSDSRNGIYSVSAELPGNFLNAGTYRFNLIFGENQRYPLFKCDNFIQFEVLNESLGSNSSILPGMTRPDLQYKITYKRGN